MMSTDVLTSRLCSTYRALSITVEDPRILEMVNEVGFKVPSYISPCLTRDFSLPLEALKPGIEFSSSATKLLDGIFFQ